MISKRLKKVSDLIENNSHVIDVGCDHGLLDIYLSLYKNCCCTAIDINDKCIQKTQKNLEKYDINNINLIKNDGIHNLIIKEKSILVILGMGTTNIIKIINDGNLSNIDKIIIQTNNDNVRIRKFLSKNYYILNELVVFEKNKFYLIIEFKKGSKQYNYLDYTLGPILRKNNDAISKQYYLYNLKILKKQYINLYRFKLIKKIRLKFKIFILKRACKN